MTGPQVIGVGGASAKDHKAAAFLETNDDNRLQLVRTRAQNWLAGLTALTGVLTTVLVLKGPESVSKIDTGWRILIAVLLGLALVALAFGVFRAHQAAYGDPAKLDEIDAQPTTGLATRLAAAQSTTASVALGHLGQALTATGVGVGLLAAAVAVSWFAPTPVSGGTETTCVTLEGKTLLEVPGETISVNRMASGAQVGPCP